MIRKYIIIAGVISSALTGAYVTKLYWSDKYNDLIVDLERAERKNLQHVLNVERLQRDKSEAIAEKIAAEAVVRETKAKIITKEVVKYVQVNDNARCELDDDWVHISDAATPVPRVTETPGGVDDPSDEVPNLGDALRVVTENYNACQDAVDRLQAWQTWWRSISD